MRTMKNQLSFNLSQLISFIFARYLIHLYFNGNTDVSYCSCSIYFEIQSLLNKLRLDETIINKLFQIEFNFIIYNILIYMNISNNFILN